MKQGHSPRGAWTIDLLLVIAIGMAAFVVAIWWPPPSTLIGWILALSLVLFAPGYGLVSLLFPRNSSSGSDVHGELIELGFLNRVVLGGLTSLAIVPAVAYGLSFSPMGLTSRGLYAGIGGLTLSLALLGLLRRARYRPAERFQMPAPNSLRLNRYFLAGPRSLQRSQPFEATSSTHVALNGLIVLSVLLLIVSVGFAMVGPGPSEEYTEVALLTPGENGEFSVVGYPDGATVDDLEELHIAIENQYETTQDYTIVLTVQSGDFTAGEESVDEQQEVERLEIAVDSENRSTIQPTEIEQYAEPGDRIRIQVFKSEAPTEPTDQEAYRSLALVITE